MNIAIVGTGYVGLVSGTCFAELGANVFCVDVDLQKIESLKQGIVPIYEPNLDSMVLRNIKAERLHFVTRLTEILDEVEIVFIAVGTPPDENGSADLHYVLDVAKAIGQNMNKYLVVVTKSTVPVGTAPKVASTIQCELDNRGINVEFDVASNPEFLKEGNAIDDFMKPDRVIVGVETEKAKDLMTRLYKPMLLNNFRVIFMDIPSAEMTKYAANSMLATRISFMNDIANLCELVGADVNMVRKGIGSDSRIGSKFLYSGCGYGGSCFPKDVKALIKTAAENGYNMRVLNAVEEVNESQKNVLFEKFEKYFKNKIEGKKVAIWGLAFKPETDDMREAPSLVLIDSLLKTGCSVAVYDPVAMNECKRRIGDKVEYASNMYDAVIDADVIFLVTEWKEFRMPSWKVIKRSMKPEAVIIDGRNIYTASDLEGIGYIKIG
ncbi:UDP-glucose dehydrogenase family protein [Bacteroides hominis]|uniref:UDP-glucose dehydrogenase family protein n=1 Tax=Bacteroides TaxID=816 RepID=UPI00164C534F|nr:MULTISPECIES: UDP-glucose/GDP-mannose dehydrogenase family protein [Bacteroides]MBC5613802.1 UDP-glucose/GDP-mannose dehydrogenase family protein [Bacteroides hominis (ex Liu et al. 2022)]MBV4188835.1 UDP-glucose/GDP-mannose dehydrogenase family protein [Bacteroides fragilis]MCS2829840.1 UDP-glucose/GDP-mannose dehydrogenase family protein [Bacteroides fragilis]MDV6170888.1 UDP-glucose/GDP-mannose dehydrogenase family protein [Bacteroides hominis (ex Liu et al. 2022)]